MPRLVSLLDLELASGTLRLSNFEDGGVPQYVAKLTGPIRLSRALPDPFFGLQGTRQAEIRMSNVAVAGDTEGRTVSQILAAGDLLGRAARARLRDLEAGEDLLDLSGVVSAISTLTQTEAVFTVDADDPAAWQERLPRVGTLDWFPSARVDRPEHSVLVPFGRMRKAELAQVHAHYLDLSFRLLGDGAGGPADNFVYADLTHVADYAVAPGDVLEYDLLWEDSGVLIGLDLEASDGARLKDQGALDQNGHDVSPATALPDAVVLSRWYRRRILLDSLAGKTITRFMVASEEDRQDPLPGTARGGKIANAAIVSANGTLARTIFSETTGTVASATVHTGQAGNTATVTRQAVYDYGPIRTPAAGSLTVETVYRDGRIVTPAEYSVEEPVPGITVVRFTRAQRDGQGSPMRIQADLVSTEFGDNPANVIRFLLEDAVYGLGKVASASSFTAAGSDYDAAGYTIAGGLDARTPAVDVLRQLLLRGAVLDRDSAGTFTLEVDTASRHVVASIALGQGDDRGWQNCEVLGDALPRIEERTKTLALRGLPDPGFGTREPAFLLSTSRTRAENGVTRALDLFFVGSIEVLDRECDYLWKRLRALDRKLVVRADLEARQLRPGDLVDVFIPNLLYEGARMELRGLSSEGALFELGLARWDESLFTYEKGAPSTERVDPRALTLTDYSRTFPAAPTNVSAGSLVTTVNANGVVESRVTVTADAPPENVTHLVFRAVRVDGSAVRAETMVAVDPGDAGVQAVLPLDAGLVYTIQVFARNVWNEPGFTDGFVATVGGVFAPGDGITPTNAPAPGAAPVTAANDDGSIDLTLSWPAYAQGAVPADNLVLFWRTGPAPLGAPGPGDNAVFLSAGATSYSFLGLNPSTNYRFGIAAARKPFGATGYVIGPIQSPAAWSDVTAGDPVYRGLIEVAAFDDGFDADSSEQYVQGGDTLATWTWEPANSRLLAWGGFRAKLMRRDYVAADVDVEMDIDWSERTGLVARYADNSNFYMLFLFDDRGTQPNGTLQLYKMVKGSFTQLGSANPAFPRGTMKTARLTIAGGQLKAYLGGVEQLSVADSDLPGPGRVGIISYDGTGSAAPGSRIQRFAGVATKVEAKAYAGVPPLVPDIAGTVVRTIKLGALLHNVVATLGSNVNAGEDVWTDVLTVTISVPQAMASAAVLILANMAASVTVSSSGSVEVYWRVLRGSTVLRSSGKTVTTQATDIDVGALFQVDTTPGLGSVTYKLQVMKNQVSGSHTVTVKPPAAMNVQGWIN